MTSWTEVGVTHLTDHHGWEIIGQSVAATRTCLAVPFLGIAFDCGYCPQAVMHQETVCLSHGHADHLAALQRHVFDRLMHEQTPPIYLMPLEIVDFWHLMFEGAARMNWNDHRSKPPFRRYQVIGIPTKELKTKERVIPAQGEILDPELLVSKQFSHRLSQGKGNLYFVSSYRMDHSVPALGFLVWEIRKKIKPELAHLTSKEVGQLVREKRKNDPDFQVSVRFNLPRFGYTGDTTIQGVLQNPDLLLAETLVIECTYLQEISSGKESDSSSEGRTQDEGHERGHIHEMDLIEHQAQFQNRELILCHFSSQYRQKEILAAQKRIQKAFGDRLKISVFI